MLPRQTQCNLQPQKANKMAGCNLRPATSNRGTQVDVKMCDAGVTCDIWRASPEDKDDDDYDASYDDDDNDYCDLDEDIMYDPSKDAMSGEDEEGEDVNVKWV